MNSINPYSAPLIEEHRPRHTPFSVAGTFRTAATIAFDRFVEIGLLILILWVPVELINSYISYEVIPEEYAFLAYFTSSFAELIVGTLVTSTVIHLSYASLQGQSLSGWQAMSLAVRVWPLLIVNQILSGLILLGAFLLLFLPGIYVAIRLAVLDQVSVLEKRVAIDAVTRSFELTRNRFGHVFLVCLSCLGCSAIFFVCYGLLQNALDADPWYLDAVVSAVFDCLSAFYAVCMVVVWHDLVSDYTTSPSFQLRVPGQAREV